MLIKDKLISRKVIYEVFNNIDSKQEAELINIDVYMVYLNSVSTAGSRRSNDGIPPIIVGRSENCIADYKMRKEPLDISSEAEKKLFFSINDYLNRGLFSKPFSTRRTISYALRLLYCFLVVNEYNLDEIMEYMVDELIMFLLGEPYTSKNGYQFDLSVKRSASTVKDYFSSYNNFISEMGFRVSYADWNYKRIQEKIKLKATIKPKKTKDVEYITPNEYELLLKNSESEGLNIQLVLKLMYEYGLRLGEVLGLTNEDVVEEDSAFVIYIRNRTSDRLYQVAYGLKKINERMDFPHDNQKDIQWRIEISEDIYKCLKTLLSEINEYIYDLGYRVQGLRAESIDIKYTDINLYLFYKEFKQTKKIALLSDQTFNNVLISLYNKAGIYYDINSKSTLSRRIRNGFAMYHVKYAETKATPEELQEKLRVASVATVSQYYKN